MEKPYIEYRMEAVASANSAEYPPRARNRLSKREPIPFHTLLPNQMEPLDVATRVLSYFHSL